MLAEARKMMDSPEFKKQMKLMEKSKEFKDAKKKTQQMMDDPSTAARLEAQMEHMVQRGEDTMVKKAYNSMSDAMSSLSDPEMMAEAVEMMKDPAFRQQLQSMASDPSFKTYLKAVCNSSSKFMLEISYTHVNSRPFLNS